MSAADLRPNSPDPTPTDVPEDSMSTTTATAILDRPAAPASAGYRLEGVTKVYRRLGREVRALAGVDLEIPAGQMVAVQGPTGGGKSTLLQMLGALDRPTSGSVLLGGTITSKSQS